MSVIKRGIVIVLDSVGCGELPDADLYGDRGSDTLGNIARHVGGLNLPGLQRLGLGNIAAIEGVEPVERPTACYGKMAEVSAGKDTTTGHWEMMGLRLDKPFPTYPDGFPPEVMQLFQEAAGGREALGNKPASGTEIIEELGPLHIETGCPIVYTSADSVFQIAAHEEVIPVEELYRLCQTAREQILVGEHAVGRVIARPFVGEPGHFHRTANRRDFSLQPPEPTLLDRLQEKGLQTFAIGKIEDIFAGRGISGAVHTVDNMETVDRTIEAMRDRPDASLIFANCVDFDSKWGHRNDPEGYGRELEAFDSRLPELLEAVREDDVLIITADHGNDPTTPSTDHSREYTPILVVAPKGTDGVDLGTRATFSDVAATLADLLGAHPPRFGTSFRNPLGL